MVDTESHNGAVHHKTRTDNASSRSRRITVGNTAKKDPSSYKILIVDDEQDIALVYKTVLEEAGFNVDVFNNPLAALSKVNEIYSSSILDTASTQGAAKTTKPYDLLLLDIKMRTMNGFDLYREINKIIERSEQDSNIKVCFITVYEVYYEQLKEEFPKIDIACFIKKPISASDLLRTVKRELML